MLRPFQSTALRRRTLSERTRRTIHLLLCDAGFLVADAVAVALAPRLATLAAEVLARRPGYSALLGTAWLVVVPISAVLVAMTLIGMPLAFLTGVVYLVLAYLGRAVLAVWLGRAIPGAHAAYGRGGTLQSFGVGGIILVIVWHSCRGSAHS